MTMKVTFDPGKDAKTRLERGFSLAIGAEVIANQVTLRVDDRHAYGEERIISYGYVAKRLFVCVYTTRGDTLHIISVRKANSREVKRYGERL